MHLGVDTGEHREVPSIASKKRRRGRLGTEIHFDG